MKLWFIVFGLWNVLVEVTEPAQADRHTKTSAQTAHNFIPCVRIGLARRNQPRRNLGATHKAIRTSNALLELHTDGVESKQLDAIDNHSKVICHAPLPAHTV